MRWSTFALVTQLKRLFNQYWVLRCYTNESYVIFLTQTADPDAEAVELRNFKRIDLGSISLAWPNEAIRRKCEAYHPVRQIKLTPRINRIPIPSTISRLPIQILEKNHIQRPSIKSRCKLFEVLAYGFGRVWTACSGNHHSSTVTGHRCHYGSTKRSLTTPPPKDRLSRASQTGGWC